MAWGRVTVAHVRAVHAVPGYSFKLVTLTRPYEPWNPDDLTFEALRERAAAIRRAWRAAWKHLRELPGVGAWVTLELAGTGNVHAHALIWGPYLHKETFERWLREGDADAGFSKIQKLRDDAGDGFKEVWKYPLKTPGVRGEAWLGGDPNGARDKDGNPALVSPVLAGRWEAAMFNRRVGDRYGTFREVPEPESTELPAVDRTMETCRDCGVSGCWHDTHMTVPEWIRLCHSRGRIAFGEPNTSAEHAPQQERSLEKCRKLIRIANPELRPKRKRSR